MGKRKVGLLWGHGINDAQEPTQIEKPYKKGDKREVVWRCPYYQKWMNMIRRCYSKVLHQNTSPTYRDCTVCGEWLYYSNFKAWMLTQDWEGKQLDKDLVEPYNKVYCPEKCWFVSPSVNAFMTGSNAKRGEYPIGVHYDKYSNIFVTQCHNPKTKIQEQIGYYDSPEEAHENWKEAKLNGAKYLASLEQNYNIGELLIARYTFKEGEICLY